MPLSREDKTLALDNLTMLYAAVECNTVEELFRKDATLGESVIEDAAAVLAAVVVDKRAGEALNHVRWDI